MFPSSAASSQLITLILFIFFEPATKPGSWDLPKTCPGLKVPPWSPAWPPCPPFWGRHYASGGSCWGGRRTSRRWGCCKRDERMGCIGAHRSCIGAANTVTEGLAVAVCSQAFGGRAAATASAGRARPTSRGIKSQRCAWLSVFAKMYGQAVYAIPAAKALINGCQPRNASNCSNAIRQSKRVEGSAPVGTSRGIASEHVKLDVLAEMAVLVLCLESVHHYKPVFFFQISWSLDTSYAPDCIYKAFSEAEMIRRVWNGFFHSVPLPSCSLFLAPPFLCSPPFPQSLQAPRHRTCYVLSTSPLRRFKRFIVCRSRIERISRPCSQDGRHWNERDT
jgi:hypothetical protein